MLLSRKISEVSLVREYTLFELLGELRPHERRIKIFQHLVRKQKKKLRALEFSIPRERHLLEVLKKFLEHEERHVYTCPWCRTRVRTYNEHTGKMECAYCDYFYAVEDDEEYWEGEEDLDEEWGLLIPLPEGGLTGLLGEDLERAKRTPEYWKQTKDPDKDNLNEAIKRGEKS